MWGPSTLAAAAKNGVVLTEDYRIVDSTRGDVLAPGTALIQPMTAAEIAALRVWSEAEMQQRIVRFADLRWSTHGLLDSHLPGCGAQLAAVIGLGMAQDRNLAAPVTNAHGLSIEWLRIPTGGSVSRHLLSDKQVLIAKRGRIQVSVDTTSGPVQQSMVGTDTAWDSYSLPPDCWRSFKNVDASDALALLITAGDHRKNITWDESVTRAAAAHDWAIDASGFVAPLRFISRAQR